MALFILKTLCVWVWTEANDDISSCCDRDYITLQTQLSLVTYQVKIINKQTGPHSNYSDAGEGAFLSPKAK